ncbi:helix-turn-helix domain-containing protein [Catellatospora methionotrophica]|uniref:helix-turn-helix domain-containing protein n=1 Tax=Catellatospora methionotrophica TaxID=121620 RepID=UPI0033EDD1D1
MAWALSEAPDVPPQCLAVLIGLANHAHPDGRAAWPSQERLAHYSRKSTRSVRTDLATLERLGLIRRGNQAFVAHLPPDRRPVVWNLAVERRRETPAELSNLAEPQSGRSADLPQPVDNRAEADFPPVADRAEVQRRPGGSTAHSGRKRASGEPSLTIKNRPPHERSLRGVAPVGAALPVPRAGQCATHAGQPAHNCGPCRSEALGGVR